MTLAVGQSCERVFHVDDAAIEAFGVASGDRNPIHFDEAAGGVSRFGGRVAPECAGCRLGRVPRR